MRFRIDFGTILEPFWGAFGRPFFDFGGSWGRPGAVVSPPAGQGGSKRAPEMDFGGFGIDFEMILAPFFGRFRGQVLRFWGDVFNDCLILSGTLDKGS